MVLHSTPLTFLFPGYSQQERRKIEGEAFSGNLLGIVATNALELGVDIGVLDCVIMLGFPFGIANFVSNLKLCISPTNAPLASTSWQSRSTSP